MLAAILHRSHNFSQCFLFSAVLFQISDSGFWRFGIGTFHSISAFEFGSKPLQQTLFRLLKGEALRFGEIFIASSGDTSIAQLLPQCALGFYKATERTCSSELA